MKAIVVETRVEILKLLERRPMTASELSRALDKHVTTISEHLELLKDLYLVERIERPGRKWIYYKLTGKGRKILHPGSNKWIMILALVGFVFITGWFLSTVDAYPGHWLYGIERGREDLELFFTMDKVERARKHIQFAEKRLAEAKIIAEKGEIRKMKRVIKDYREEIRKVREEIEGAKRGKRNVVPVLEKFAEETVKHRFILKNVAIRAPRVRDEIRPLLRNLTKEYEDVRMELEEITGKPYVSIEEIEEIEYRER